jgi:hypothetical protein
MGQNRGQSMQAEMQSPWAWFDRCSKTIVRYGYKQSKRPHCVH